LKVIISDEVTNIVPNVKQNRVHFLGKIDEHFLILPEFPDENIISICEKYYRMLKMLVDECNKNSKTRNP